MRKTVLIVALLFILQLPSFANIIIKDSETFAPLQLVYFEKYSYPNMILEELGYSDINGSIEIDNNTSVRYFIYKPNYESFFGEVTNNTNVYLAYLQQISEVVDVKCGIPCSSDISPEEGGKSLTENCICVCNSVCPRNTIQTDDCSCQFPIITNPQFNENISLYSQVFIQARILSIVESKLKLVNRPSGCEISIYSAVNQSGIIMKTLPCIGSFDGKLTCSFSIDDNFYIANSYSAKIRCGLSERSFNFNIEPSRQSNILNVLVSWTKQSTNFVGYFVLLMTGIILWGLIR